MSKKNKPYFTGQMNQPPTPTYLPHAVSQQVLGPHMQQRALVQVETHAGPIPPPEVIEGYEKVLAGSANRIIKMAENEQTHRQKLERRNQLFQTGLISIGQLFAFLMGMSGIAGGVYLVKKRQINCGFWCVFYKLERTCWYILIQSEAPSSRQRSEAIAT